MQLVISRENGERNSDLLRAKNPRLFVKVHFVDVFECIILSIPFCFLCATLKRKELVGNWTDGWCSRFGTGFSN
jgi:hypothetical protein